MGEKQGHRLFQGLEFRVGSREEAVGFRTPLYEAALGSAGIDDGDSDGVHLVATGRDGEVRACLRLELKGHRRLAVESFVALIEVVRRDAVLAEISRFVVRPDSRAITSTRFVHLGMLKLVYEYSLKEGITDLVTLSLPHLNKLYELALFRRIGQPHQHSIWGEVQPMHLDIARARGSALAKPRKMTRLLFEEQVANVLV